MLQHSVEKNPRPRPFHDLCWRAKCRQVSPEAVDVLAASCGLEKPIERLQKHPESKNTSKKHLGCMKRSDYVAGLGPVWLILPLDALTHSHFCLPMNPHDAILQG